MSGFVILMKQTKPIPTASGSSGVGDNEGLAMDVYSGVRWSAVAKYGAQATTVVTSIIVARIVAPEAYGLLGMAFVITGFLRVFQSLGLGSALIQRKEINQLLLSSVFFVSVALGVAIATVLVCGAPLFSWIYGDARVGPIIVVLSLTFLISSPAMVPSALLNRRLAFQRLAWIDISVSVISGVSAISLAVVGWGVWALVWSAIAGIAVHTVLVFLVSQWRPRWSFSWPEVRSVFGFGANLTGFSIFNYFARNADNLIIGVFLGATPLGYYSLAYRILLFPREAVTGVLTRVLFPAFSRMQDDDARLKDAYLRVCGAIAFITFPMMLGMVAVAEFFVKVVLGEDWMPAVPLIMVLAPIGMVQTITSTYGQLYLAKGRADWMFRWGIVTGVSYTLSFVIGAQWGVVGVAVSYALTCCLLWIPGTIIPFRLVKGLAPKDLLVAVRPVLVASILMMLGLKALQAILITWNLNAGIMLVSNTVAGCLAYGLFTLVLYPTGYREFVRLLPGPLFAGLGRSVGSRMCGIRRGKGA